MKTLETNDWVLLNNIIFKIYSDEEPEKMRRAFLENIKPVLNFDSADFYVPAFDNEPSSVICYNCDGDTIDLYEKYRDENGIMYGSRAMVYRDTDMIKQDRTEMLYYRDIYNKEGWDYSLHMTFGRNGDFLGAATFYRYKGKEDFDSNDIFVLDMLREHLSLRLQKDRDYEVNVHDKMTVAEASEKYGLTKQEHMVLGLLMDGTENTVICEKLSISINTLKKHILNIYRKLGIKNRVQMFKMIKEKDKDVIKS
ncbi:MAG: helix-turn-helix transcriptional regulator [Clostridia bacterium]|nr:helix-turn-helix transcriptional regulator [Clostridia bacterium]